jgi:CheY-like chemotaxis protein
MSETILIVDDPALITFWSKYADSSFGSMLYGTGGAGSKDKALTSNNVVKEWSSCQEAANAISLLDLSELIVLINAHCGFSGNSLSVLEGLRVVELLRMEIDFDCPILVYGWLSLDLIRYRAERGRWSHLVGAFTPIETIDQSTHTAFTRLPTRSSLMLRDAKRFLSHFGPESRTDRLELARVLIEDEQERLCRSIRHKYQNVLAAQRLLLGGFLAGDVSHEALQVAAKRIGNQEDKPLNQLDELRAKWANVENELAIRKYPKMPVPDSPVPTGLVLVVDDHFESMDLDDSPSRIGDRGWRPVYEALLNSRRFGFKVVGVTSYDAALRKCNKKELKEFQLIVLDLDLGKADKSGLRLLQEIRSRDPFVPVLIMTSFDDAEVCQTALELQADGFFAKQLRDKSNISSRVYYEKFIKTVKAILEPSTEDRALYNDFVERIDLILSNDDAARANQHCARLEDGVLGELTKFFLLLRAVGRHYLTEHLLCGSPLKSPSDSLDELIIILLDAVTAWLNWDRPQGLEKIGKLGDWIKEQVTYCEFWLDANVNIVKKEWSKSANGFFGYGVDEVTGMPFSFLFSQTSASPSVTDLNRGWQNDVFITKKDLSSSLVSLVVWKRRRGRRVLFNVQVQKPRLQWTAQEMFIEETRRWTEIRHGAARTVTLYEVRQLARDFLRELKSTASKKTKIQSAKDSQAIERNDPMVTRLIRRAQDRERAEQRSHSVRSKMGAEAVLLGTYINGGTTKPTRKQGLIDLYGAFGPDEPAVEVLEAIEQGGEESNLHIPPRTIRPNRAPSICLLDDHGKENGWAYVCQLIHNDSKISNVEFAGAEPTETLETYLVSLLGNTLTDSDLLLLDLRMPAKRGANPEIHTGLRVAEVLKKWDPLLSLVLLSARSDSITMRNAVALGATEFFPKEVPGSISETDLSDYATRFADLTEKIGIADEVWFQFRTNCRVALRNFDSILQKVTSQTSVLPSFLLKVLDFQALQTDLPSWLKLPANCTLVDLRRQVVGHTAFLFRRAIYFALMQREPFLSRWLDYFTSAIPSLRPKLIGYDQVWLNCAMISELILNVTAIAKCGAQVASTPLTRKVAEAERVRNFLGTASYELSKKLWEDRNDRRYGDQRNPTLVESEARQTVSECIQLLNGIGFLTPNDTPNTNASDILECLRQNLERSIGRARLLGQLTATKKSIEHLQRTPAPTEAEASEITTRIAERMEEEKRLRMEMEFSSIEAVLRDRHVLLQDLLPPSD